MNRSFRRLGAVVAALGLVVLVACDIWVHTFRTWWDAHSLTGSIVSNLLVLAVTGLIVDEVVARRQRKQRRVSVAVQGLIVYGQARRAYGGISTKDDSNATAVPDELRSLASMLLTASSTLFDDPEARLFLEQVERFTGGMYRALADSSQGVLNAEGRSRVEGQMSKLTETVGPLLERIPPEERAVLEGSSRA